MKINFTLQESSASPLYAQLAAQIDRHLRVENAPPGTRLPDLRSLATMADVSLRTADRAINELMRRGLCIRRPKKGTFWNATAAVSRKTLAGIYHARGLHSFESDLVQSAVFRGITQRAVEHDMELFFIMQDAGTSLEFYRQQETLTVKGTAMLHWETLDAGLELAERFPDMHWVYINYWMEDFDRTTPNIYGVFNDDQSGAYQMTEHLLQCGHRRIAVFGLDMPNYRQRTNGFKRCLMDHNISFDQRLIVLHPKVQGGDLRAIGAQMTRKLLASRRGITAIFCVNDIIAAGACDYLRQNGALGRIQVVGYDHIIPSISQENNFSTVAIDFEGMGAKAMDLIARLRPNDQKTIRIAPRLIIRNNGG